MALGLIHEQYMNSTLFTWAIFIKHLSQKECQAGWKPLYIAAFSYIYFFFKLRALRFNFSQTQVDREVSLPQEIKEPTEAERYYIDNCKDLAAIQVLLKFYNDFLLSETVRFNWSQSLLLNHEIHKCVNISAAAKQWIALVLIRKKKCFALL